MATPTNGPASHDTLLSYEPLSRHGACWYYVWQAYAANGASTSMGSTSTAYQGWNVTWGKHPGDRNPPNGAAIWLGRRYDGNMDGDVFIAGAADGQHAATDQPSYGQTGLVSIQARMDLCGREYLGWTEYVCDAPINMGGGGTIGGNQRQTGANGANQRSQPNTQVPSENFIDPWVVADFNGWINGEAVEGNPVWFRGAHSGLWSWSGGFTDTGTHDLTDLNVAIGPTQRQAGPNGANGRGDPSTSGPVTSMLAPGAVGNFTGWKNGENVQGNPVWFQGTSGNWFWSGGFTDTGTHDLTDLNNPDPPDGPTRTVASPNPANVRNEPYTSSAAVGSEPSGTVIEMDAWATGDTVENNAVWYRRASDGKWMWSGGFTSTATDGLTEVEPPDPNPTSPDNPRGLPEYTPVYPRAVIGLEAPLGFADCANPVTRASRDNAGGEARTPVIDRFIIHWAWPPGDDTDYFSYCNDRSSCPTTYTDKDARTKEMIRPGAKPAATGPDWNWRSWAVEVEPINDATDPNVPPITDAQLEEVAQQIAFLASFDGKQLDGVPVNFQIDATHVITHRDAIPGTDCPGDYLYDQVPNIIARAQEIADGGGPDPVDPPLDPEAYPTLYALMGELDRAFGHVGGQRGARLDWWRHLPPVLAVLVAAGALVVSLFALFGGGG